MDKKINTQAFWLVGQDGVPEKLARINTIPDLALEIIKRDMIANDLRFITKQKKKFVQLWIDYFKTINPEEYAEADNNKLLRIIAEEIFSGHIIKHRKNNGNIYSKERAVNSRTSKRIKFSIYKTLESILVP